MFFVGLRIFYTLATVKLVSRVARKHFKALSKDLDLGKYQEILTEGATSHSAKKLNIGGAKCNFSSTLCQIATSAHYKSRQRE